MVLGTTVLMVRLLPICLLASLLIMALPGAHAEEDCQVDTGSSCAGIAEDQGGSTERGCVEDGTHDGSTSVHLDLVGGILSLDHTATKRCTKAGDYHHETTTHEAEADLAGLVQVDHDSGGYQTQQGEYSSSGCGGSTRVTLDTGHGTALNGPCLANRDVNRFVPWGDLLPA